MTHPLFFFEKYMLFKSIASFLQYFTRFFIFEQNEFYVIPDVLPQTSNNITEPLAIVRVALSLE